MRILTILIGLTFLTSCDCYQRISGTVLDNETGKPLKGVTVYNKNKEGNKTITDTTGNFILSNVSGGFRCPPMTIMVENTNYKKQESRILTGGKKVIRLEKENTIPSIDSVYNPKLGKANDYDWTKIKEFKFYGFNNPNDKKDSKYLLADESKIESIFKNLKKSDGFVPKGASRFVTIIFDNKKQLTIQIISGGNLPFRVIKNNNWTDEWYSFGDITALEWVNYINKLTEEIAK